MIFSPKAKQLAVITKRSLYFIDLQNKISKPQVFENRFFNGNVGATFFDNDEHLFFYLRNSISQIYVYKLSNNKWEQRLHADALSPKTESYAKRNSIKTMNNNWVVFAQSKNLLFSDVKEITNAKEITDTSTRTKSAEPAFVRPTEYYVTRHPSPIKKIKVLNQFLISDSKNIVKISKMFSDKTISLAQFGHFHSFEGNNVNLLSIKQHKKKYTYTLRTIELDSFVETKLRSGNKQIKMLENIGSILKSFDNHSLRAFATINLDHLFFISPWGIAIWKKKQKGYNDRIDIVAPFFSIRNHAFSEDEKWLGVILKDNVSSQFSKLRLYAINDSILGENFKEINIISNKTLFARAMNFSSNSKYSKV
ncbi:hypothetical protein [Candidatus Uabimicrobium sp. HlEnr_7]|uniref:hypothetical protein n=1 Tax=Candidatus Uabimicrobium helgolandensis TaxID=3095367 RepID=UPI0035569410